jgi:hypothetical protein
MIGARHNESTAEAESRLSIGSFDAPRAAISARGSASQNGFRSMTRRDDPPRTDKPRTLEGYPALAREWHPTKNGRLFPRERVPRLARERLVEVPGRTRSRVAGSGLQPNIQSPLPLLREPPPFGDQLARARPPRSRRRMAPDQKRHTPSGGRSARLPPQGLVEMPSRARARLADGVQAAKHGHRVPLLRGAACRGVELARPRPSGHRSRVASDEERRASSRTRKRLVRNNSLVEMSQGARSRMAMRLEASREGPLSILHRLAGLPFELLASGPAGVCENLASDKKNGELAPRDVFFNSTRVYWWRCERGHEFETSPAFRARYRCPYCAGNYLTPERSLAKRFPTHPQRAPHAARYPGQKPQARVVEVPERAGP